MSENKCMLLLKDRKELEVTGVKEVISFDENGAVLLTEDGELCVEGSGIRISNLDTDSGKVSVLGRVDAMMYSADPSERKRGLKSRLFG